MKNDETWGPLWFWYLMLLVAVSANIYALVYLVELVLR